ncbi:hypothetical protein HY498_01650 [Candidatus Woesearchaeota archaeon]|nr:hypothetical protein [Candidatus Woesearchaeota archaeon]
MAISEYFKYQCGEDIGRLNYGKIWRNLFVATAFGIGLDFFCKEYNIDMPKLHNLFEEQDRSLEYLLYLPDAALKGVLILGSVNYGISLVCHLKNKAFDWLKED